MFRKWTILLWFCITMVLGQKFQFQTHSHSPEVAQAKIRDFKLKLKRIIEERLVKYLDPSRQKYLPTISSRPVEFGAGIIMNHGCVVEVDGSEIPFLVTSSNTLLMMKNFEIVPIRKFPARQVVLSVQAFEYVNGVLLITHRANQGMSNFIEMYEISFNGTVSLGDTINLFGPSILSVTKSGSTGYIAVASNNEFSPYLKMFRWDRMQVDEIASINIDNNFSAVDIFHVENVVYVALSYAKARKLLVKRYNDDSEKLETIQLLDVEARIINHFNDSEDYYLVCGTQDSVVIYRWNGSIFFQDYIHVFSKNIYDIAIHRLSKRVLIAVILDDEIKFLIRDQLTEYALARSVRFNPINGLKSALLWEDKSFLYMMSLFQDNRPVFLHRITLEFKISDPEKDPRLEQCLPLLHNRVSLRQKKLDEILPVVKNRRPFVEKSQTRSLKVNGRIRSLRNVTVGSLLMTSAPSPLSLHKMARNLSYTAENLRNKLTKTIRKSGAQFVKGRFRFKNVSATKTTIVGQIANTNLNKVKTSRLPFILKKKGNQAFEITTRVYNISCRKANTMLLNGNRLEDYVLMNSSHLNLTGLSFSNVSVQTMSIRSNMINGLNMSDFILTSTKQEMYGIKKFKNLSAKSILSNKRVNEVQVDKLEEMIASINLKNFSSPLKFLSTLTIGGNLTIKTLNNYDVLKLYSKSVWKDLNQTINGKTFLKMVTINGSVIIHGKVNNCSLNQLMTINTDQTIYSNLIFSNFSGFETIITDSLNGIDLSEKAVVKYRDNLVSGTKIFRQTFTAFHINLKEGTTIDNVDPSVETYELIKTTNDRNFHNSDKDITLGTVVTENLEVDAENFPLLNSIGTFWLKTTKQNISSLNVANLKVANLQVSKINDVAMDDFVTVNDNVSMDGLIKFEDNITIHTLNLAEGCKLNFDPEFWNPNINVKIMNKEVTLENAVLENNLKIGGAFEGMDFMLTERFQTLNDEVEFENISMKELVSEDLKFQFLNNINFTDYFENSVVPLKKKAISNKNFKTLKGISMMIEGTLNNVSLDRVATTNTKQNVTSPWIIANDVYLAKVSVDSFFDGILLEDVVYVDKSINMSNKRFNGVVSTTHLITSGLISGVNFTHLQINAFNKSAMNNVRETIKFHSDVNVKELQVNGAKIDNVDLKNLISLHESTEFEGLNASLITGMNVTVEGLINGCHWMSVLENALLHQGTAQNVTSAVTAKSLVVNGNLTVGYLNGDSIPDWISLLSLLSVSDIDGDMTFENLKAENIHLPNHVNNISLEFLMGDVVRKSMSQVINSRKNFTEINVDYIIIDTLNSEKSCGVNVSNLFEMSINRSESSSVLQIRSLGGLNAKQVTIEGYLNNLKLPNDVILQNTSEIIQGDVIINNTVNATLGLNVNGTINSKKLEDFIKERVTLINDTEELFSSLKFTDDSVVSGNTRVNGTINGIYMNEILKKSGDQIVNGTKVFVEGMNITSDLKVNGSVNGLFLDEILLQSRDGFVRKVQISNLNTSSLNCSTINGLNVIDFYNFTYNVVHHVYDQLYNFTTTILSFNESLRLQKDSTDHPLSLFNYFDLHEILDYGIIERFLPIYEYGTYGEKYDLQVTQMVMWVGNGSEHRTTKSLVADVLKTGKLNVTKEMQGKIFPFSLMDEKDDVVGFYVQAGHSRKCSSESTKCLFVKTIYSNGTIEEKSIASPENATLIDVQLLEIHDIFLLTAYNINGDSGRIFVYLFDIMHYNWSLHQMFHEQNVTSIDMISVEKHSAILFDSSSVYLVVTGDKKDPGLTVYEWDFELDEFFLKTNASSSISSHALWIEFKNALFLLLAKEKTKVWKNSTWVDIFIEPLEVYTLEEEELFLNHTVNVKGVTSLEVFMLSDELFVLASSNHMKLIYVLQYRGYNGFEVIQEIPALDVTEAKVYTVDSDLYLALSSKTGKSRILKASIRGGRSGFI